MPAMAETPGWPRSVGSASVGPLRVAPAGLFRLRNTAPVKLGTTLPNGSSAETTALKPRPELTVLGGDDVTTNWETAAGMTVIAFVVRPVRLPLIAWSV